MYTPKKVLDLKSLFVYKQSRYHFLLLQLQHNNSNSNNNSLVEREVSIVETKVENEGEEIKEEGVGDSLSNLVRLILMT